jgi:pimeloyl-ACP methyl ester carboxylesterase
MKPINRLGKGARKACGGGNASQALQLASVAPNVQPGTTRNFLLIHGAWHSSIHWNRVCAMLAAAGHRVCAIDLPGAGLNTRLPRSYVESDFVNLSTEPSPLASIKLDDYRRAVIEQLEVQASHGKVTLVAHSLGGVTATTVAEAVPELIERIVYVAALVPVRLASMIDYGGLPENAGSLTQSIWVADPAVVGAARINPKSPSASYLEKARQAFYNDLSTEEFLKFAAFLVPDVPIGVALADGRGTAARWGKIPRTYIRCTKDQSQPIALQDLLIREADAATPENVFEVRTLDSSHSPFASMPDKLAAMISS